MKNSVIVVIISIFILSMVSWATDKADFPVDGKGIRLQACAPTPKNDAALTGKSQTISVDGANCWKGYLAADTKFRCMSTATKVGMQHTIPGGGWHTEVVSNYKFVNFSTSGATGTFRSDKP